MESPEIFDSPFFSLDSNMPTQAAFDDNQQGSAQNQLHVPRQGYMPFTQHYAHSQSRQAGCYPASPQWQLHSRQHQHAMPQYGNHYTFGARHHPFAMAHALHAKTVETKARLDKKHVEILEQEFAKNQKPSSIVKRELAEQMGHEIARINVRIYLVADLVNHADMLCRTGSRTGERRRSQISGPPNTRQGR